MSRVVTSQVAASSSRSLSSAVSRIALSLAVVFVLALTVRGAPAQDVRQNEPGKFDFYVLTLSWSPSFCAASAERSANGAAQRAQCGDRPFSFAVHGFWPQYEKGFPEYCQNPAPKLDRATVSSMLDLMPTPRQIFHEWDRHGSCSGLSPHAYFEQMRRARAAVKIPESYLELTDAITTSPDEIEDAFVKANPGLTREEIAVTCDSRRLNEVRICMSHDLKFQGCGEIKRRACRRDKIVMPPMRKSSEQRASNASAVNVGVVTTGAAVASPTNAAPSEAQ